MGIRNFFRKIKLGFSRIGSASIPYVSDEKRYGNYGEDEFVNTIKLRLPSCRIKENVMIRSSGGNAEIDCLLLYQDKLFAIEVKRWKGSVSEQEAGFLQQKTDRWTRETHSKYCKSPFKQLGRAIYLFRKEIQSRAWINDIVFFRESDSVSVTGDKVWFNDMSDLVSYIQNEGRKSRDASTAFQRAVPADLLYAQSWGKSLKCIIPDEFLCFETDRGTVRREDISVIRITHHWSYDDVCIALKNNSDASLRLENAKIKVINNGNTEEYALCKLDCIVPGREI